MIRYEVDVCVYFLFSVLAFEMEFGHPCGLRL